jgi:hypothetical protein
MSTPATPRKRSGCPLCGRPTVDAQAPFCSRGCRDRDLLNWLGEGYRVPGPPAEEMADGEGLDTER